MKIWLPSELVQERKEKFVLHLKITLSRTPFNIILNTNNRAIISLSKRLFYFQMLSKKFFSF